MAVIEFSDGNYVGRVKNGKPNGKGTYNYSTGDVYVGLFKDGVKHGKGQWNYKTGTILKCNYVDGLLNGPAEYSEKNTYSHGEYLNDKRHGEWIFEYQNGSKHRRIYENGKDIETKEIVKGKEYIKTIPYGEGEYHGRVVNDLPDGEGVINYKDGSYLKGQFKKGKKYGPAVEWHPDGREIRGFYKYDGFYGQVTFVTKNKNSMYVGEWKKRYANGYGKSNNKDNDYEGFFKKGKFHGKGFLHDKVNKIKYRGTFKEGMKQGNFEWSYPNDKGTIFTTVGKFVNDLPEGKHTFKCVEGEGYCFYKNGNKEGKEYYFYIDGGRRIIEYKNGKIIDDYYL